MRPPKPPTVPAIVLLLVSMLSVSCARDATEPSEPGLDSDSHTDIDVDSDNDVDADTDVEPECDPPTGVTDWGGACDPQGEDCPADTYCVTIDGMDEAIGYCTPLCCEGDNSYCADIGNGQERCLVSNEQTQEWWCVVLCNGDEDCSGDTTCQNVESTEYYICYGGEDPDTDTGTGTDTGSEPCPDDEVAACAETYGTCQLACEADTDSLDECVAECFETYCACIVGLGCDPAEYDCS